LYSGPNHAVVGSDSSGFPTRVQLSNGDSVLGRVEGSSIQELRPWMVAHNLYQGSGTPGTLFDTATGLQNPWLAFAQWPRCHSVRWQGAADVIVQGLYTDFSVVSPEFRQDKLIINDTGSLGSGTFRNIVWKKEDTAAGTSYRIWFESAVTSTDFAEYVQPPGTSVLLRWHPLLGRWLITPMVPSGRIDRGVATVNTAAPTTIHTHQTNLNNRLIVYKVQVWGLQTAGAATGDSALFDITAMFRRDGAGVVTEKDITFVNGPYKDAGAAAWDVTFVIVMGLTIEMRVTGEAVDTTIQWRVTGNITEHG